MKSSFLLTSVLTGLAAASASGQILISSLHSPYTQNFNTLASSGTSSVVPLGWGFLEAGPNANGTYAANNGSSATANTYSYGSTGSSERAFGERTGSGVQSTLFATFQNGTGGVIPDIAISYRGEQWRRGNGTGDRLDFQYSLNGTTWTDFNTLDFNSPGAGPSNSATDGNAAGFFTSISGTITGLNIPNGNLFYIRWRPVNVAGNDDGLAIDDFSLTAVPEPHEYAAMAGLGLLGFAVWRRSRRA